MRNELISCYRTYIGEMREVSEVDVFTGTGLAMAGLAASVAGWALYFYSETLTHGSAAFWTTREAAVAVVGLGVPAFMLGVVVLLLGNGRTTRLSLAGFLACLGAVGLFVFTYPDAWAVTGLDASVPGVTVYGLGLLGLTFATGAAFSCRIT
jgi:hypothetical protein